jgi:hypothetical protein
LTLKTSRLILKLISLQKIKKKLLKKYKIINKLIKKTLKNNRNLFKNLWIFKNKKLIHLYKQNFKKYVNNRNKMNYTKLKKKIYRDIKIRKMRKKK